MTRSQCKFLLHVLFVSFTASLAACKDETAATGGDDKSGGLASAEGATENLDQTCPDNFRFLPSLSLCAAPIGNACFRGAGKIGAPFSQDLVSSPEAGLGPIVITVGNDTGEPLYFEANPANGNSVKFEALQQKDGGWEATSIPENSYCNVECPAASEVMERDCAPPVAKLFALQPGEELQTVWSGRVQLGAFQLCGDGPARFCMLPRAARADEYTIRVCGFPSHTGDTGGTGKIVMAAPKGEPLCLVTEEKIVASEPIGFRFEGKSRAD